MEKGFSRTLSHELQHSWIERKKERKTRTHLRPVDMREGGTFAPGKALCDDRGLETRVRHFAASLNLRNLLNGSLEFCCASSPADCDPEFFSVNHRGIFS